MRDVCYVPHVPRLSYLQKILATNQDGMKESGVYMSNMSSE